MKKRALNIFIVLGLFASCNTPEKNTGNQVSPAADKKQQASSINCYRYAGPADTITLKIIHIGESVTGGLVYKLKEKDSNKGTIQGFMKGDLLVAAYTFWSEGIQSTRQVAFKLDGDSFIEGYGEIQTKDDGKQYFKNIDALSYNDAMKLIKVDCQ